MQIELATKCNFQCTYCFNESGPRNEFSLEVADVLKLVDEAESMGVTWLDLTGGELLIYQGWQEIVRRARTAGLVLTLHTNGLLLTERNVAFLVAEGVRGIQVTVESHHADVHASVGRGSTASHARVLAGVKRAKAAGLRVRLAALVHRKNIDHIGESVAWFHENLDCPVTLDRLIDTGVDGAAPLAVSEAEFWEAVAPVIGTGAASASRVCDNDQELADPVVVEPDCGVAHSFVYITSDGHYSLCPTMTHREEDQFAGPTVSALSLQDAWYESDLFTRLRGLNCENVARCPAGAVCGGGCRSNAYTTTGRLTAPDVISCNTFKNPNKVFVNFLGRYSDGNFRLVDQDAEADA
ncbi:radical SAM protein [Microbacterium sp.]|uniref:radical SAM protein n=1 Tax=Microbacterium sp. TaxID=51671 RepID=UPI003F9B2A2C